MLWSSCKLKFSSTMVFIFISNIERQLNLINYLNKKNKLKNYGMILLKRTMHLTPNRSKLIIIEYFNLLNSNLRLYSMPSYDLDNQFIVCSFIH